MQTAENIQFNPADFTGILNKMLLAIGKSQSLREMLQSFMMTAVNQLKLNNTYVYLLDTVNAGADKNQEASGFHYFLSYTDRQTPPPHQCAEVIWSFNELYPCAEETVTTVDVESRRFFIYSLKDVGIILLEFGHLKLPAEMANVLSPVMHQLSLASSACLTIYTLKNQINSNKSLEKSYEEQANRDPLTKLPNRRAFRYNLY
ncbi:MAG: hypothetical protein KJP15_09590, partial [Gammaproteobacteria bacterium]|nr:hypothetical protein [Gammaproteobacteria bacterium]